MKSSKQKYFELIQAVMQKAEKLSLIPTNFDKARIFMSLEAANEAFNIDFEAMLKADDFNFAHDFVGINNNVIPHKGNAIGKPYTSKDFGFFLPRFAQQEGKYKTPQHDSVVSNKDVGSVENINNINKKI